MARPGMGKPGTGRIEIVSPRHGGARNDGVFIHSSRGGLNLPYFFISAEGTGLSSIEGQVQVQRRNRSRFRPGTGLGSAREPSLKDMVRFVSLGDLRDEK